MHYAPFKYVISRRFLDEINEVNFTKKPSKTMPSGGEHKIAQLKKATE
jgi:hypothetical protein